MELDRIVFLAYILWSFGELFRLIYQKKNFACISDRPSKIDLNRTDETTNGKCSLDFVQGQHNADTVI